MSSLDHKIGHNSVTFDDDALLADDYVDLGPLSGLPGVNPTQLDVFRHAIRTQGNEKVRQKAITQMLNRARANAALSPAAYRLLEHIARRCRGPWRYCTEPQDTIGFFCGIKHRQSTQRTLAELDAMDLGFIASIEVPCSRGGRPRRYYTVACTGSDRLGSSDAELAAAAARRKLEVMNDRASARLAEALQDKAANCFIEPKQQNVALSKATSRCNAKQHNVAHSVSTLVQEESTYRDTSLRSVSPAPSALDDDQFDLVDFIDQQNRDQDSCSRALANVEILPPTETAALSKRSKSKADKPKSDRRPWVVMVQDPEVAAAVREVAIATAAELGGDAAGWTQQHLTMRAKAFDSFYRDNNQIVDSKNGWPGRMRRWLFDTRHQPRPPNKPGWSDKRAVGVDTDKLVDNMRRKAQQREKESW